MAGKTESEAHRNFQDSIQEALSCVTVGRLTVPGANRFETDHVYAAVLQRGDPVQLAGTYRVTLSVSQNFRIVEADGDHGRFDIRTVSYFYVIATREGRELLAYHWEPENLEGRASPHLHVGNVSIVDDPPIAPGRFHRLHLPTARVPLEQILRFLIEDLRVTPLRSDWSETLESTEAGSLMTADPG